MRSSLNSKAGALVPSARQQAAKNRDKAQNKRKAAPYGRFEDGSPKPAPKKKQGKKPQNGWV